MQVSLRGAPAQTELGWTPPKTEAHLSRGTTSSVTFWRRELGFPAEKEDGGVRGADGEEEGGQRKGRYTV